MIRNYGKLVCGVAAVIGCALFSPESKAEDSVLDFPACVDLMLRQSPLVMSSALGVSIEKLDESDSRSEYFPQFSLRARYYLDQPEGSDQRYVIAFIVDPYNPVEAHLSLRARKLLARIAALSHIQTIAEALERVAKGFFDLAALEQSKPIELELLQAVERRNAALTLRFEAGALSEPEMRTATQQAEILRLQQERNAAAQEVIAEGLATFLGLPENRPVVFQTEGAEHLVLNGSDPSTNSWVTIQTNSVENEIQEIQLELQDLRITAARAAYVPDVLVGLQTPDPLSGFDGDGFFFSLGLDIPLWDGLTRARDITRQRQTLEQMRDAGSLRSADARARWRAAEDARRAAEIEWRTALLQEDLALIKSAEAARSANIGNGTNAEKLSARMNWLQARLLSVRMQLAYSKAKLNLRLLSGDLLNTYCITKVDDL